MLEIRPEFVLVNLEAPDAESVIMELASILHEHGMVGPDYGKATVEREGHHSTGLPTRPFPIAIPHADAEGVFNSALAVATLAQPIGFLNMADPDEELPVELVILIANNSPEEQVETLRNLATVFGEPEKLNELRTLNASADIAKWLEVEITSPT